MDWAGQPKSSAGIARVYAGVADCLVADENTDLIPTQVTDVLMTDAAGRARVAEEALQFALSLGR